MPFTFSHPALVLPMTILPKRFYSLTGLIVGSTAPDFEYFIKISTEGKFGHSIVGIFAFCLPVSILLTFIYHTIVRDALIDNLPPILKTRVAIYKKLNWLNYFNSNRIIVLISLLIGICTHLLWDSFTHEHGYFVNIFSPLRTTITLLEFQIPFYRFLQHSSSLVGAIILAITIFRLPKQEIEKGDISFRFWGVLIGLAIILLIVRLLLAHDYRQFNTFIIAVMSCGLFSLVVTPLILASKKSK